MARDKVLKPGCRHIDPSRIKAGTNVRNVVFQSSGKSERVGSMTESIERVDSVGLPSIRRTTVLESERLGHQRTVAVVEAADLSPMAYEAHLPSLDVSARYQDGRVTGLRKQGTHTQLGSGLEIPRDAFDIGTVELLVRTITLSDGWSGKFNVVDPVAARVTRGRLTVTGEERVGDVDCWVVASIVDSARVEYAVAKDSPDIVRQTFSPRKGVIVEFA